MGDSPRRTTRTSPMRLALAARQLRRQPEQWRVIFREPIAIVGRACRFPGADSPQRFWQLLVDARDAIGDVPQGRWDENSLLGAASETGAIAAETVLTRRGAFLDEVDQFDAEFFGISPREAQSMDPQQRLMLEVAWEALEDAGEACSSLRGSATGIFAALSTDDFGQFELRTGDLNDITKYSLTGASPSVLAGRLSHLLGLLGPSLVVDTACSSSLVALHLACTSLHTGECDMALTGGVNLMLTPELSVYMSKLGLLSRSGSCRPFDADADGYVRGEGCGVLVLKRLSDAVAAGNRVLGLVRGSAMNHTGTAASMMAPYGPSQIAVIREALSAAGVDAEEVDYVECHAMGLPLADAVEVQALATALADGRSPQQPITLGSLKPNIGHLEAASGVAGVIKVLESLAHEQIPPVAHLCTIDPAFQEQDSAVRIPAEIESWPRGRRPRVAGVSGFGFSGTNAQVVIEETPHELEVLSDRLPLTSRILTLSAKTNTALRELAGRYSRHVRDLSEQEFADACFTSNTGRMHFRHRLAITSREPLETAKVLEVVAAGGESEHAYYGSRHPVDAAQVGFVFSGGGAAMLRSVLELYETEAVVREAIDRCDVHLRDVLSRPLPEVLALPVDKIAAADSELVLFASEYALAQLFASWAVAPAAVVGFGVGQYVAAHTAGIISLDDALRLLSERRRYSGDAAAALRVWCDEEQANALLDEAAVDAAIVSIESTARLMVAGNEDAMLEVARVCHRHRVRAERVDSTNMLRLPLQATPQNELDRIAGEITYDTPHTDFVSSTGEAVGASQLSQTRFWRSQLAEPARPGQAIQTLHGLGCGLCLHLGAGWAHVKPQPDDFASEGDPRVSFLPTEGRSRESILTAAATLHAGGVDVDWVALHSHARGRRVALPTYPFQRQRYWPCVNRKEHQSISPSGLQVSASSPRHRSWRREPPNCCREWGIAREVGLWILFTDRSGLAVGLAEYLRCRGDRVFLVDSGTCYKPPEDDLANVSLSSTDDLRQMFRDVRARCGLPVRGVVYLAAIDSPNPSEDSTRRASEPGTHGADAVVDAFTEMPWLSSTTLTWITRGAQDLAESPTVASSSRAVSRRVSTAMETGRIQRSRYIDLDPDELADDLDALLDELLTDVDRSEQIAIRGATRYVGKRVSLDQTEVQVASGSSSFETASHPREGGKTSVVPIALRQQTLSPDTLLRSDHGSRYEAIVEFIATRAAVALGREPSEPFDHRIPLKEIGFDSLMAIELVGAIGTLLGVSQPARLLSQYPSIEALARHIEDTLVRNSNDVTVDDA